MEAKIGLATLALLALVALGGAGLLTLALHDRAAARVDSHWIGGVLALALAALLAIGYFWLPDRRPVLLLAALVAMIVVPQLLLALRYRPAAPEVPVGAVPETPTLSDVTSGVMEALSAQLASYRDGSSVMTADYGDEARAEQALERDVAVHGARPVRLAGRDGFVYDSAELARFFLREGPVVVTVQASDARRLKQLLQSTPGAGAPPASGGESPRRAPRAWLALAAVPYGALMALVLLRLYAWAGTVPPAAATALPAAELRQRLLAINALPVPLTISRGSRPEELIVDWRWGDANWVERMREQGVERLHRFVLRLDESGQTVRVREYDQPFDESSGGSYRPRLGFELSAPTLEPQPGLQFRAGRPTVDPSYRYRFSLDEMRTPLVQAIADAGWRWRPVVVFAPPLVTG